MEFGLEQWLVLAGIVAAIGGFAIIVVKLMIDEEMGRYALSVTIITAVGLVVVSLLYGVDRQLHVHHWTLAIILSAYLCYQDYVVLALQGLLNGVMIEGIARWGLDPIWEPKK